MAGKKFGKWNVSENYGINKNGVILWKCICDCGNIGIITGCSLRNGTSKSCGCSKKDSARNGKEHHSWKGGKYINDVGYNMIYNKDHSRTNFNGYVREHIILAEKALGKSLPMGVQVHHYGKNGNNDKIVICQNQEYHYLLHIRAKAYEVCGNANYRKCKFCKEYDDPENLSIKHLTSNGQLDGWSIFHIECRRDYEKQLYWKNKNENNFKTISRKNC